MCPDLVTLSACFDNELTELQSQQLASHVFGCPVCGKAMKLFEAQREFLHVVVPASGDNAVSLMKFWHYAGRLMRGRKSRIRHISVSFPFAAAILSALILSTAMHFLPANRASRSSVAQVEPIPFIPTVVTLTLAPNDVENLLSLMEERLGSSRETIHTLPAGMPVARFGDPQILLP